jgi:hypothetical protein
MKALISIISIMLFALCACDQNESSPIEGVWKVVAWERFDGDSVIWNMPGNLQGEEILIFAKEHYNWVGRYKLDTSFIDNFGGGTYTLEGNKLEVKIQYYGNPERAGTTIRLLWEIQNDTAVQTWPCDENWELMEGPIGIQKWVRIE